MMMLNKIGIAGPVSAALLYVLPTIAQANGVTRSMYIGQTTFSEVAFALFFTCLFEGFIIAVCLRIPFLPSKKDYIKASLLSVLTYPIILLGMMAGGGTFLTLEILIILIEGAALGSLFTTKDEARLSALVVKPLLVSAFANCMSWAVVFIASYSTGWAIFT